METGVVKGECNFCVQLAEFGMSMPCSSEDAEFLVGLGVCSLERVVVLERSWYFASMQDLFKVI